MSPLHINILLHYHARTNDYALHVSAGEMPHARSVAVREFLEFLTNQGLLSCRYGHVAWAARESVNKHDGVPLFAITEKGRAMVDALRAVQIPVCKWVQPEAA